MKKKILIKSVRRDRKTLNKFGDCSYNICPVDAAIEFMTEAVKQYNDNLKVGIFQSPLRCTILGVNGQEIACIELRGSGVFVNDFIQQVLTTKGFSNKWAWREIDSYEVAYQLKW
jgi:hypothetical protein